MVDTREYGLHVRKFVECKHSAYELIKRVDVTRMQTVPTVVHRTSLVKQFVRLAAAPPCSSVLVESRPFVPLFAVR